MVPPGCDIECGEDLRLYRDAPSFADPDRKVNEEVIAMAILSESDLHDSQHWLWAELAERHRTNVQHAAAHALFDDVRPAWEEWFSTHPAPVAPPPSELLGGLLANAVIAV
jgi:hypothetical protein